jgi:phosphoribosylanthranilate isomerase
MIVQIYEIQTPEEASRMLDLGVDHIGSVLLSEERWNEPCIRETVRLATASGACSSLIPLFRNASNIFRMIDFHRPGIVHFCEALAQNGSPEAHWERLRDLQAEVRRRFPGVRVMRSIPIAAAGCRNDFPSIAAARFFEDESDFFLTDTLLVSEPSQPVPGFVGITGRICDWSVAAALVRATRVPVILAGGIGPDNVADGIAAVRPAGVDSCTKTNARDGEGRAIRFCKDLARVRRLVMEARRTEGPPRSFL